MRLIGNQSGIGVALAEYFEPVDIPFIPSPFCNPDIKEHRRVEVCKDLKNNLEYRAVGVCKHKGCKGKKFYKRENLLSFVQSSVIIPQDRVRRYDD